VLAGPLGAAESKVSYPKGFRNWYHVKSMVIMPGHPLADPFGGIHHIYCHAAQKASQYVFSKLRD